MQVLEGCSAPLVAAHFEDGAPKLPFVDLREVLNFPGEFAIQLRWLGTCGCYTK